MQDKRVLTQPLKGFRDSLPEDMVVQNYIFNKWRKVCQLYGFEEYDGPVLENIQIYNKSGQDIGTTGKELFSFTNKGGKKVALRPEMTPTVGRMIAAYGKNYPKPIRWFSISQFFREEKPQRGRGREFYQLNADIFGDNGPLFDFEVIKLAIDITTSFGATEEMFEVRINNRKFSDFYFEKELKILDQKGRKDFLKIVDAVGSNKEIEKDEVDGMSDFAISTKKARQYFNLTIEDVSKYEEESEGARELLDLFDMLKASSVERYCRFSSSIARGLDYYTGMVFEVFDKNPKNNRSMFGGGRYDDLLDIFQKAKIPAVGFGLGDWTAKLFLKEWNLIPSDVSRKLKCLVTVFPNEIESSLMLADELRKAGISTELYLNKDVSISRQVEYADKKGIRFVLLIGPDEVKSKKVALKDMNSGVQKTLSIEKVVDILTKEKFK